MRRSARRVLLSCAIVLAACGSGAGVTTTLSGGAPTSTADPVTTAPVPESTTTTAPTTSSGGDGAEGSGCSPGGDVLPDGLWFGFPVELGVESIGFDLACWFTGRAAVDAAAEDGAESPPPNDYYIRNENPAIRPVAVEPSTPVTWYPNFGDPTGETIVDYAAWMGAFDERGLTPGVWISIEDGSIVDIREQWVP